MADKEMKVVFERPHALLPVVTNYCPGCSHGIVNRLVAECLDELDVEGSTVGIAPVGCTVTSYDFYGCDMIEAAHGRAPAVATAVKRALPDGVVFAYQGDGDLASIGMAETVHAATRGENITVVFVNNAIYGMTGGQMAPTSLPNQVTQTSPYGRNTETAGFPIRVCELLSSLDGVAYLERVTVDCPKNVRKAKKAIKKAFQTQIDKRGYSLVEIVGTCPTNWGMTPEKAERYSWPQALLAMGLLQAYEQTKDKTALSSVFSYLRRWKNSGYPIAHVDHVMNGSVALWTEEILTREKREDAESLEALWICREGADICAGWIKAAKKTADGILAYRSQHPDWLFADTLGMLCPFACRYGVQKQDKELLNLGIRQLELFFQKGMDEKTGLPYHGYDEKTGMQK